MNQDCSITAQVAITLLPKLNSFQYLPLFEKCGGIENFFKESDTAINKLCKELNISNTFNRHKALQEATKELKSIDSYGIQICTSEHHNFPHRLRQCEDAPLVFFYKGTLDTSQSRYLAIVGTRKASDHCKGHVEQILKDLHDRGHQPVIVSGLAFGIDITTHNTCLKNNLKTYAVLGHGLNMIYPASHKHTAEKIIAEGGALITEFPCSAPVLPINFLQRNRIIAGLCDATLLAESAVKGGGMATARIASSYNREVMALPGRPEDKMSAGCNLLIKQNIAALIENAEDVARILNLDYGKLINLQTSLDLFSTEDNEEVIFKILTLKSPVNIDELTVQSGISINELTALLMKLELEGLILSLPGKNYILN